MVDTRVYDLCHDRNTRSNVGDTFNITIVNCLAKDILPCASATLQFALLPRCFQRNVLDLYTVIVHVLDELSCEFFAKIAKDEMW